MKYNPTIGLEIHLQLATKSKMFCDCPNVSLGEEANTNICPVCTGQPGSLPILNKKALEMILKLGLALDGEIEKKFFFERKNYFYPDLPKGYQISQKRMPIIRNAKLDLSGKKINISEIHLEEDTAKIFHVQDGELIDFNRAGVPLLEIVTTPEIESSREAKQFCEELQQIVRALGISEANMEKGEMRCEINISLRKIADQYGQDADKCRKNQCQSLSSLRESVVLGTRVEVKNLNSFRAVERAIEYEIKRQTRLLEQGEKIIQETRGWDDKNQITFSQRIKEEAEDYRYFPEPDLPVFVISEQEIKKIKESLPELPSEKRTRLVEKFSFNNAQARILASEDEILNFVEEVMKSLKNKMAELEGNEEMIDEAKLAKKVGDWIVNKLFGLETNLGGRFFEKIRANDFAEFMFLVMSRRIFSNQIAENTLRKMYETGKTAEEILSDESIQKTDDREEIKKAVELVLENYPEAVADYKKGKKTAIKYLIGQVMVATKGKADPKELEKIILKFLE